MRYIKVKATQQKRRTHAIWRVGIRDVLDRNSIQHHRVDTAQTQNRNCCPPSLQTSGQNLRRRFTHLNIAVSHDSTMAGVARSLKEAARLTNGTKSLILRASEDLICKNMMCAKLGEACVCRLALTISRLPGLQELDLADNDLGVLPESVFELPGLESLDISGKK